MRGHGSDQNERARHLMMAALDGELSPDQRTDLDRLLSADAELRAEWERLVKVKEVTGVMSYREPPDEIWETYWISVYNRLERGVGWILLCLGTLALLGFGIWEGVRTLLADTELPGFVKIAVFVAAFGGTILLFSVIREKLFARRRDAYKEIQR